MKIEQEKQLAENMGFTCTEDERRGWGWCKFQRLNFHVWICSRGWATAYLIKDRYMCHEYFDTLEDALKRFDNDQLAEIWDEIDRDCAFESVCGELTPEEVDHLYEMEKERILDRNSEDGVEDPILDEANSKLGL